MQMEGLPDRRYTQCQVYNAEDLIFIRRVPGIENLTFRGC